MTVHLRGPRYMPREAARNMLFGWKFAAEGNFDQARHAYAIAEDLLRRATNRPISIGPEISLLRHMEGEAEDEVWPEDPETDVSIGVYDAISTYETDAMLGLRRPLATKEEIAANVWKFMNYADPGHHPENIQADLPHVMVLSTGRCGTMSLYRLLWGTNVLPYHSYWFHLNPEGKRRMMHEFMDGTFSRVHLQWLATRAAEWLTAINIGRPMVALNHWDTIFAPAFALIHPRGKFLHLHRDKELVYRSFYEKHQYGKGQLEPLLYAFTPYRWMRTELSEEECIVWYLQFTEMWAEIIGKIFPERFCSISSDKLFAGDRTEIYRMLNFIGCDVNRDFAVRHFTTEKINHKPSKLTRTAPPMPEVSRETMLALPHSKYPTRHPTDGRSLRRLLDP